MRFLEIIGKEAIAVNRKDVPDRAIELLDSRLIVNAIRYGDRWSAYQCA